MQNYPNMKFTTEFHVICDGIERNVNDVEFIDVQEDELGRDLMTYAFDGFVRKSYVISRPSQNKD